MSRGQGWAIIAILSIACVILGISIILPGSAGNLTVNSDAAAIELLTRGPIISPAITADIDGDGFNDLAYLNTNKHLEVQFAPNYKERKEVEIAEIVAVGIESWSGGYESGQQIVLVDNQSQVIRLFINEKTDRRIAKMAEFATKFNPLF